jgi:hypothetical protein
MNADWPCVYIRDVYHPYSVLNNPPRKRERTAEERIRDQFGVRRVRPRVLRVHLVEARAE